jgi:TolB-like protein/DNA-binding winged helix-turn-helix (wHTH) protein/Tfp pilus assembly protein PilF
MMQEAHRRTTPFKVGDWTVDPAANRLFRGEREVRVEPKVMRVLTYLAERQGEVVSRHDLEAHVWTGMIVTDDAVTNTVIKLRRALGDKARNPAYIETIAKSGYRLIAKVSAVATQDDSTTPAPHGQPSWSKILIIGLLVLSGTLVFWFTARPPVSTPDPIAHIPAPGPLVAVLPFENLSADPEQDYFSDGITEDLITDLSKIAGLRVVARNSVFAYKGSTETEQQIGADLRARYIVKGSVRRAEQRLRINVRLADATDGSNRWAERYDREISDIFRVQDEITRRVVGALRVTLSSDDRQRLLRKYTASVEAYDLFLHGLDHYGRRSGEDNALAKDFFERAIAIDPGFARAYAGLALTYTINAVNGWGATLEQSLTQAEALVNKAQELDADLPQVHFVTGEVQMYRGNYVAALDEVARAIELKPSYADAYALLGWVLHFAGRPQEGLVAMQRAIELNPNVPGAYRMVQGALRYALEEFTEAVRMLELAVEGNPNYQLARVFLAAAHAAAGHEEEAKWQISEILMLNPDFSLADVERGAPFRDPAYRERFLRDLKRAGLGPVSVMRMPSVDSPMRPFSP